MEEPEIWRDIKGFERLYQVSNYGKVRSLDKHGYGGACKKKLYKGRVLQPVLYRNKYLKVKLCRDGIQDRCCVHRLVADAFIPNPNGYPIINHIDCNTLNNSVTNLEWCTHKQNSKHAYENGRLIPPVAVKGLINELNASSKKVIQMSLRGDLIREWPSMSEADRNGFNVGHISSCCKNKLKSHKGFLWAYKK